MAAPTRVVSRRKISAEVRTPALLAPEGGARHQGRDSDDALEAAEFAVRQWLRGGTLADGAEPGEQSTERPLEAGAVAQEAYLAPQQVPDVVL